MQSTFCLCTDAPIQCMTRSKEKSDNESRTSNRSTIDIPIKLSRLRKSWGHKDDKLEPSRIKRWIKMKPAAKKESSEKGKGEKEKSEKVVLFKHNNCKITAFQDSIHNSASGSHLGQGTLTIYAIYQESTTYLHCGSVIYPLLAKSKILRIAHNRFVLSLYNPERYWQITLLEDASKSDELARCFEGVCSYFDMYSIELGEREDKEKEVNEVEVVVDEVERRNINENCEENTEEMFSTGESTVIHHPKPVKMDSQGESFKVSSKGTLPAGTPPPHNSPKRSPSSSLSSLDEALDLMSCKESSWMQPYEPISKTRKVSRRTSWALQHYASVHDFNT